MDTRKIIIILLVVIIILLVGLFALVFNESKTGTVITVTSNSELCKGDNFSVLLTDSNSNPLVNQTVTVVIIDSNGTQNKQTVTTDGSGNGALKLDNVSTGDYTVEVYYEGDFSYSSSSVNQTVKITDSTVQVPSGSNSGGHKVTLVLTSNDQYFSKTVGEYKIEAMKWMNPSLGGLGVWVYKNGELIDRYSYTSRAYFNMNGEWKWSQWKSGEVDSVYHKYNVGPGVQIERVEVSF